MFRPTLTEVQRTSSDSDPVQSPSRRSQSAEHPLLHLQRSIGNQAVQRLMRSRHLQAKLQVGEPDDELEQEADRVAATVMRAPDLQGASEVTGSNRTQISSFNRKYSAPPAAEEALNTQCVDEKRKGMLPGKADADQGLQVSEGIQAQIESLRGGGQQMPESLRAHFETRFGHDFSGVRLHTGSQAAEAAQKINAKAFTVGREVAFAAGQYAPGTEAGKRLLAHELTHVIQQNGGTPGGLDGARRGPTIQRQPATGSGTDYGLAREGSRNKYVAEAIRLWTTQKSMKIWDFVDALMKVIQADLLSQGVPKFPWRRSPGLGVSGMADSEHWVVKIDPDAFSARGVTIAKLADLTLDEVQEVVGTLYHESRHIDQDVLLLRVLLDQKKPEKQIGQETKIPAPIVKAVKATKFKTPLDQVQVEHATRMFAVMYGEHNELLTFLMKNSKSVDGVLELKNASNADDLKKAAPHVKKLAEWVKNILEPKVKKLASGNKGSLEAQLEQDLGELNQVTPPLLAAFAIASKLKNPTDADLQDLRDRATDWEKKLQAAYRNLEGEKDAFRVEELVKNTFQDQATESRSPSKRGPLRPFHNPLFPVSGSGAGGPTLALPAPARPSSPRW